MCFPAKNGPTFLLFRAEYVALAYSRMNAPPYPPHTFFRLCSFLLSIKLPIFQRILCITERIPVFVTADGTASPAMTAFQLRRINRFPGHRFFSYAAGGRRHPKRDGATPSISIDPYESL